MTYRLIISFIGHLNKTKNYRFGNIQQLSNVDKTYILGKNTNLTNLRKDFYSLINDTRHVIISIGYQNEKDPYPDILSVDLISQAMNQNAISYFINNELYFQEINTDVTNEPADYKLVVFPTLSDYIDMNKGNVKLNENGNLISTKPDHRPTEGEIFFKKEIQDIKGIHRVSELGGMLVCDEETKTNLENSGLTAFYFKPINISDS